MPKPSPGPVCRLLILRRLKWLSVDGRAAPRCCCTCEGGLFLLPVRPNVQKLARDSRGEWTGEATPLVVRGGMTTPTPRSPPVGPSCPCPKTVVWPIRCVGTGLMPTPPVSSWRNDGTRPRLGEAGEVVGDPSAFDLLPPAASPAPNVDVPESEYFEPGERTRPRSLSSRDIRSWPKS